MIAVERNKPERNGKMRDRGNIQIRHAHPPCNDLAMVLDCFDVAFQFPAALARPKTSGDELDYVYSELFAAGSAGKGALFGSVFSRYLTSFPYWLSRGPALAVAVRK